MNKHLEALRAALAQQRKYEAENWPFVNEDNKPTGTGESITYHLACLYNWSPGYVLTLPDEQRDERLREVWRSFVLASDIIKRYEDAVMAFLQQEEQQSDTPRQGECIECGRDSSQLTANGYCEGCIMGAEIGE